MTTSCVRTEETPAYRATANNTGLSDNDIIALASAILYRDMERGPLVADPDVAGMYCATQLHGLEREAFGALFLDNQHRVLGFEILFQGTIDGAQVYPREVVKAALRHNAAAVIVTHNHPSGHLDPSAADRAVTSRLKAALEVVDVRLLDHFIVGPGSKPVSFAARGLL